jgi:hypothetical protein
MAAFAKWSCKRFFAVLQGLEEWRKGRKKMPVPAARAAE